MKKMKLAKNVLAILLVFAAILLTAGNVSADTDVANIQSIEVDGTEVLNQPSKLAVTAGETISVRVWFEAIEDASDLRMEVQLEGEKDDSEAKTGLFSVEEGHIYSKVLIMKVPYELQDDLSENITMDLKIWNDDFRTEDSSVELRVHRPSYTMEIMSIESSQSVRAGNVFPVDVVIKNRGYENLDEILVTASIPGLGIEKSSYFGDLVSLTNVSDEDDTKKGRFFLEVPFDANAGEYTISVEASNDESTVSSTKKFSIVNDFSSGNVFVDSLRKTVESGKSATFQVSVANPSNSLKVFRVVTQSQGDVDVSPASQIVSVPAGMSKSVEVSAMPQSDGEQKFDVNVISGEELVGSKTLSVAQSGESGSSGNGSVVALTIILAVIFLVLLGILFVLLRKKPEQTEDIGESYY